MMNVVDFGRTGAVGPSESARLGELGGQFAAACHGVVCAAREEQLVGVGAAAASPVRCMVHLAAIPRFEAIGTGAATVAGVAAAAQSRAPVALMSGRNGASVRRHDQADPIADRITHAHIRVHTSAPPGLSGRTAGTNMVPSCTADARAPRA